MLESFKMLSCVLCKRCTTRGGVLFCMECSRRLHACLYPRSLGPRYVNGQKIISFGIYKSLYADLLKMMKAQPFGDFSHELRLYIRQNVLHWSAELLENDFDAIAVVPSNPIRSFFQCDLSAIFASEIVRVTKKALLFKVLKKKLSIYLLDFGGQKFLSRRQRLSSKTKDRFYYEGPK